MASQLAKNSSAVGANLPPSPAANQTRSPQVDSGLQRTYSSLSRTMSGHVGHLSGGLQRTSSRSIGRDMNRQTVRKRLDQLEEYKNTPSAAAAKTQGHGN
ncbi:hypothetical protein Mapa_012577 [Marchantia paleacea]|nr:hypothetical protein Mapa_012577 [Marchantia paleacea]